MTFDTNTLIIIGAILTVLVLAFLLMRPRKGPAPERKGEPYVASKERPYMKAATGRDGSEGNGVTDEVAAATADVAGEVLCVDAHGALSDAVGPADDLGQMKGVGPKFVARLHELGITRFDQIAGFGEAELAHLDERLGPFRGRLARDRVAEQADYLARGDIEGFEEKFGRLGG